MCVLASYFIDAAEDRLVSFLFVWGSLDQLQESFWR